MGYRPKQLIKLSLTLAEADMLVSIHLSDNGLYDNGMFDSSDQKKTIDEILDIFGAEPLPEKDPRDFVHNLPIHHH